MDNVRTFESNETKAILYFVHGLGEHVGRYERLFNLLSHDCQIRIHAINLPGHGIGTPQRGHAGGKEILCHAVRNLLLLDAASNLPKFLMGHSLGGLIVLSYLFSAKDVSNLSGVIVSAPPIKVGKEVGWLKLHSARLASRILPSLTVSNEIGNEEELSIHLSDPNSLSRDPDAVAAYKQDPLVHNRVSLQTAVFIFEQSMAFQAPTFCPNLPDGLGLLYLQGSEDRVCLPEGARGLFERIGCADKTLRLYEGAYHECKREFMDKAMVYSAQ